MPPTDEERAAAVREIYGPQVRPAPQPALPPITPEQYELMKKIRIERERERAEAEARARLEAERRAVEEFERRRGQIKGKTLRDMFPGFMKGPK